MATTTTAIARACSCFLQEATAVVERSSNCDNSETRLVNQMTINGHKRNMAVGPLIFLEEGIPVSLQKGT